MPADSLAEVTDYDITPYKSYPFAQSNPIRLATIAYLFGMTPVSPRSCRVLELGCASGGNLIPMAAHFPKSTFWGVDASKRAISDGQKLIADANLTNIQLVHNDILQLDVSIECFDYIIAHGVFSWTRNDVQQKMFEICGQSLSPNGVAYISYNANPGWRMRGLIRELMLYRSKWIQDPDEKLHEARQFIEFLASVVPPTPSSYGMLLKEELSSIQCKEDFYLSHDFLETINTPLYFSEFIERAQEKGLQYLGEADFGMMSVDNFAPTIASRLRSISRDVIQLEQNMDFVRNRFFRQTLLCRRGVALNREPNLRRLLTMSVASDATPDKNIADSLSAEEVTFSRARAAITTRDPLLRLAMTYLRDIWPRSVVISELLSRTRSSLTSPDFDQKGHDEQLDVRRLLSPLLRGYSTGLVDLAFEPVQPFLQITPRPYATPLVRSQALAGNIVTNIWHNATYISNTNRYIIQRLDGTLDEKALTNQLRDDVLHDRIVLDDGVFSERSFDQLGEELSQMVAQSLRWLSLRGLLAEK